MPDNLISYLKGRHIPENINIKHRTSFKLHDRLAVIITSAIGSMYAVYFFIIFVSVWILWQSLSSNPFDPYPFIFMIFISNIVQLILVPLIMVGQNIQNRHAQLRAEEEYQATKSIHQDIETILTILSNLDQKPKTN